MALLALATRAVFELGYHRDLSRDAASELSPDARRLIINANLYIDIRSVAAVLLRRKRHALFRMHFDDCFGWSQFRQRWEEVEALLGTPGSSMTPKTLARALGRAQHAGQDYYAHSSHVEQVTRHHPSSFRPVTYRSVMDEPAWGGLRERWQADRRKSVDDALISGAYFTSPPTVEADRGEAQELHHRTLNKDRPIVEGPYLYREFDRSTMHFRALACARLESDRLAALAAEIHPESFAVLRTYRSGLAERTTELTKYWFAVVASIVSGHWR